MKKSAHVDRITTRWKVLLLCSTSASPHNISYDVEHLCLCSIVPTFFLQWYCFFFFLLFSNLFQVLNYKNCDNSERNFDFYCRHGLAVVDIVRQEPMACCSVAGSTRSNNTRCDAMPTDAWTGSPRQGGSTMSSDSKVAPMRPAKDRSWPLRTRL